ncbi:MAG: serine/threonine-protein phosphatase [Nigerium sp.]|nr:serine/threonine-protein phosphatase [Nigerium sp.]
MSEPRFEVRFGAATHQGLVRPSNEDSYLTVPPVFLVADGMGGHSRGEVASRAVADAFLELGATTWLTSDRMVDAVDRASASVTALAGEGRAPGATLAGVGLSEQGGLPCWLVFNIGDSRVHLLRGGELVQISVDHSAVQQASSDDGQPVTRTVVTRALGAGLAGPVADQWLIPAQAADRVLICSDGLSNEVTGELIAATLLTVADPQEAAQALIQAALSAGGHDNVTVVVVDCADVVSTALDRGMLTDETVSDDTIPDGGTPDAA